MSSNKIIMGKGRRKKAEKSSKLYTLVVCILGGPVGDEFEGQTISRTIQIRGDQTLKQLHKAIFKAFNRSDEHFYEFNLGVGPDDRSKIYSIPVDPPIPELDEELAGDVAKTSIDSLGLQVGQAFGYLFDFGDSWMHQINVAAIGEVPTDGKYPKIIERVGKSPPQYPDEDE